MVPRNLVNTIMVGHVTSYKWSFGATYKWVDQLFLDGLEVGTICVSLISTVICVQMMIRVSNHLLNGKVFRLHYRSQKATGDSVQSHEVFNLG